MKGPIFVFPLSEVAALAHGLRELLGAWGGSVRFGGRPRREPRCLVEVRRDRVGVGDRHSGNGGGGDGDVATAMATTILNSPSYTYHPTHTILHSPSYTHHATLTILHSPSYTHHRTLTIVHSPSYT